MKLFSSQISFVILAAFLYANPESALGQDHGIDFIVLVDVSHSQVVDGNLPLNDLGQVLAKHKELAELLGRGEEEPGADLWNYIKAGSDPDRIRWRAIQLLVDMLDADDRIVIQRFNRTCPASDDPRRGFLTTFDRKPQLNANTVDTDFSPQFLHCDPANRKTLDLRIAKFNQPVEQAPFLDQGGTDICEALGKAFYMLKSRNAEERRRPARILLLSDGADDGLGETLPKSVQEFLRSRWKLDQSEKKDVDHPEQLPVTLDLEQFKRDHDLQLHTIGLNLKDSESNELAGNEKRQQNAGAAKAKGFLKQLATGFNGEYHDAENASELIELYRNLIRDIKGLWERKKLLMGKEKYIIKATPNLHSLRFLSWVELQNETTRKPNIEPDFVEWDRKKIRVPRHESFGGIHKLYYYLGSGLETVFDPNQEGPTSPFPEELALPVDSHEDVLVHLLEFKDVGKLFPNWQDQRPTISRFEHYRLPVDLPSGSLFSLDGFRFHCKSSELIPGALIASATLRNVVVPGDRPFLIETDLTGGQWKTDQQVRQFVVEVSAEGIALSNGNTHALTGFTRKLPPIQVTVKNSVPLKLSGEIYFTRADSRTSFILQWDAAHAIPKQKVPVRVVIRLPRRRDVPRLDPDGNQPDESAETSASPAGTSELGSDSLHLTIWDPAEPGDPEKIELQPESNGTLVGAFEISTGEVPLWCELSKGRLPDGDVAFHPGSIKFLPGLDDLTAVPVELPINISLGKLPIQIKPVDPRSEMRNLNFSEDKSSQYHVVPVAKQAADTAGGCTLTLSHSFKDPLERKGPEKEIWIEDAEHNEFEFGPDWQVIASNGVPIEWPFNKPFVLSVNSTKIRMKGTYKLSLTAEGPNYSATSTDFTLYQEQPQFQISPDRFAAVGTPGCSVAFPVTIGLEHCPNQEERTIALKSSDVDLTWMTNNPAARNASLRLIAEEDQSWTLTGGETRNITLQFWIPHVERAENDSQPFAAPQAGRFSGSLEFSGAEDVLMQPNRVAIEVLVDWAILQSRKSAQDDWSTLPCIDWQFDKAGDIPVYRMVSKQYLIVGDATAQLRVVQSTAPDGDPLHVTARNMEVLKGISSHAGRFLVDGDNLPKFLGLKIPLRQSVREPNTNYFGSVTLEPSAEWLDQHKDQPSFRANLEVQAEYRSRPRLKP